MVQLATHEWHPVDADAAADAPVAVLVHGGLGWHRTWWRVGPALAERGWRVVAVDLRGHGESPRLGGPVTIAEWATDLAEVIERIGPPVDLLIGHSLGAKVVIELAHRRPNVARRLVLEDPPSVTRSDDSDFQHRLEAEVRQARMDPEAEVRRELAENPRWLEEDARQDVEGRALADLDGLLASLRAGSGVQVLDLAPVVHVPTLYLLADEERSVLGGGRERLLGSLPPSARALTFDSGHTVHRDRFEEYLTAIGAWVEETAPAGLGGKGGPSDAG